jgi:glycosidase
MSKKVIYQLIPRCFGNAGKNLPNGSINENGCGKFADITSEALASIAELGCTHIWYTGVLEHATQTDYSQYGIPKDHPAVVKGKAGSPYAIKDYFDVDPDLAVSPVDRKTEFLALVNRTHETGLKVIIDFVPNHLARCYHSDAKPETVRDFGADDQKIHGFDPSNNFYYIVGQPFQPQVDLNAGSDSPYEENPAKATGNDCFSPNPGVNDWYDTIKLNYGVDYMNGRKTHFDPIPTTWFKMLDVLTYWCEQGVDGFRCDMAEMVPVEFWHWAIARVKKKFPETLFIAEIYQPDLYCSYINLGGFDVLYDKEGMYNTVRGIVEGKYSASDITGCWQRVNNFQQHMLTFLENHDEQRIASDFFAANPCKALPGMFVLIFYHKNPVMIYAGQELGETGMYAEGFSGLDGRNSIFDYWSLETLVSWKNSGKWNTRKLTPAQRELRETYKRYLTLAQKEKAVTDGAFFDLQYANNGRHGYNAWSLYSFIRKADNDLLIGIANFSESETSLDLVVPKHAFDCLGIPEGQDLRFKDLLSGEQQVVQMSSRDSISFSVSGYGARLFKAVMK